MAADAPHRRGGLAAWAIGHPIGVSMIALAVVALGFFALGRLPVNLLPHIVYPHISVRILDPGVPARIMEDEVTRQLEEQLAITEGVIGVESESSEGTSAVDLDFGYGEDIDTALQNASARLDRAKRFLPDTIDPPIIYKRDPSQIPVLELVVSSDDRDPVALRDWVDYDFSKRFLNLPGVASVEVGGGMVREVQVLPDLARLSGVGLTVGDMVDALEAGNLEEPAGRLDMAGRELVGRTAARFESVADIAALPLRTPGGRTLRLDEVAQVLDTHEDHRIRVRFDGRPGVKVSVQKQPEANTVAMVDAVRERLAWLRDQGLVPEDVAVRPVADQAHFVRRALDNAVRAAAAGTLLAMAVVYLFLGNLRRTLIIGSAIPLAVMVTFVLMGGAGLTFNIMTLGGLALGIGLLVDSTIVMLENIHRHQRRGEYGPEAGRGAAAEIHGAIIASTSTNLAAVLPFLFVGGLIGLLFRELIFTISAAIVAALVVALTLVPALGVRVAERGRSPVRRAIDAVVDTLQGAYAFFVDGLLRRWWLGATVVAGLAAALAYTAPLFFSAEQQFLPEMDRGQARVWITADPGTPIDRMDRTVQRLEALFHDQPEVESVYTIVGGFIFGRTTRELSNRSQMTVQLRAGADGDYGTDAWVDRMQGKIEAMALPGLQVRMYTRGVRGIRVGRSREDIGLRIQGPELETLGALGDRVVERLADLPGVRNLRHSSEEIRQELAIRIDRRRAADLGLDPEAVGRAARRAVGGEVVTDYLEGDRRYNIRLRLARSRMDSPRALEELVILAGEAAGPVHLGEVARVELVESPAEILRDNQQRIVEVTGEVAGDATLGGVHRAIRSRLAGLELPPGYTLYESGAVESLREGQETGRYLLALALFLVFVVMAVQYESLRNPLVILLSVPFAAIGVALGLRVTGLPLSMPVWLGMIMLAGIVVNNAIVLVAYIEQARERGLATVAATVEAARLRLRPILMTTLTTVAGMLPLALGLGEGAEMLQPLAVAMVSGLSFSLLVTLVLIPVVYRLFHPESHRA